MGIDLNVNKSTPGLSLDKIGPGCQMCTHKMHICPCCVESITLRNQNFLTTVSEVDGVLLPSSGETTPEALKVIHDIESFVPEALQ